MGDDTVSCQNDESAVYLTTLDNWTADRNKMAVWTELARAAGAAQRSGLDCDIVLLSETVVHAVRAGGARLAVLLPGERIVGEDHRAGD